MTDKKVQVLINDFFKQCNDLSFLLTIHSKLHKYYAGWFKIIKTYKTHRQTVDCKPLGYTTLFQLHSSYLE